MCVEMKKRMADWEKIGTGNMLTSTHAQIDVLLVYILSISVKLLFTVQKLDSQQEKEFWCFGAEWVSFKRKLK